MCAVSRALGDTLCPAPCPGSQAIRDGVIEASINHEKGYVQSKEMIDIYSTREPQLAFHQRISFCLDIHNMSVKVSTACPWLPVGTNRTRLRAGSALSSSSSSSSSPGHEVPTQILQQGLGIRRGEVSPGSLQPPRPREGCGFCPHLPPTSAFAFQERREREQQDLEFAKEMAEDDDDGFP